jgi:hypothetical protein
MTFTQVARHRRYWQAQQSQIADGKEDKGLFEGVFWMRITIVTVSCHLIFYYLLQTVPHLSRLHQALTFILQLAKLPNLPDAHIGVANNLRAVTCKSLLLNVSRSLYARTNLFERLPPTRSSLSFLLSTLGTSM